MADSPYMDLCRALQVEPVAPEADAFGRAMRQWAISNSPGIPTLSLFSGAGGLDIAFADTGFDIQVAVEIEEQFARTLRANAGAGTRVVCDDIRNFKPKDLFVRFIIGGPPCQTFSAAGRRVAGAPGTSDARGSLFEEYVRLLKQLQPDGFLFENVYGITGAELGKAWERIQSSFSEAGYQLSWRVLDAADFGAPQHRERLFIVGARDRRFLFPAPTHGPDSPEEIPFVSARRALDGLEIHSDGDLTVGGRYQHLLAEVPPGLNYSFFTEKMGHPNPVFAWRSKFSDFLYKADPDAPVRTLKAQGGQCTGPFHWDNRRFTLAELKRLQTIPDAYRIAGARQQVIHQIGNSVPPQPARILAMAILDQVFGAQPPVSLPTLEPNEKLGFRSRKRQLTETYRKKAQLALSTVRPLSPKKAVIRRYQAQLTKELGWEEGSHGMAVTFTPSRNQWLIEVDPGTATRASMRIELLPAAPQGWDLPVARAVLMGHGLTATVFTGLWKAIEREMQVLHYKTDLVQLSGYYQYPPRFTCSIELGSGKISEKWRVAQHVISGIGTREILPASELAAQWGIPESQILKTATWLRELGFEVRNHCTNPQIVEGSFLIPYAFPTMATTSVQRRKSLVR